MPVSYGVVFRDAMYFDLLCPLRSKFKAGEGDLELYCAEADELHKELLSCPRPLPRIATTPLPPTPRDEQRHVSGDGNGSNGRCDSPSATPPRRLFESRRMSRSEGDLKNFVMQQPPMRSAGSQQHLLLLPRNNFRQKVSIPLPSVSIPFRTCKSGPPPTYLSPRCRSVRESYVFQEHTLLKAFHRATK